MANIDIAKSAWRIVAVLIATVMASCGGSGNLEEDLQAFPAPSHLVRTVSEESGSSLCLFAECPNARLVYVTEQTPDVTCEDLREVVGRWEGASVQWAETYLDEEHPCRAGGTYGGADLGVDVFDADLLVPSEFGTIPPPDRDLYQSGVSISLYARGPSLASQFAVLFGVLFWFVLTFVAAPVGLLIILVHLVRAATRRVNVSPRVLLFGGVLVAAGVATRIYWS